MHLSSLKLGRSNSAPPGCYVSPTSIKAKPPLSKRQRAGGMFGENPEPEPYCPLYCRREPSGSDDEKVCNSNGDGNDVKVTKARVQNYEAIAFSDVLETNTLRITVFSALSVFSFMTIREVWGEERRRQQDSTSFHTKPRPFHRVFVMGACVVVIALWSVVMLLKVSVALFLWTRRFDFRKDDG